MSDPCAACGEPTLTVRIEPFVFTHGGQTLSIDDEQSWCANCGTVSYIGEQISRHELAVAARIRQAEGLLSAEALRAVRMKYAFRQTDLEAMLSVGPKTWTRWERGKVPQSKAADTLIRLLAADPDIARRLMELAGIDNPAAKAVFARIEADTERLAEAELRAHVKDWPHSSDPGQMVRRVIAAVREARFAAGEQAA
jgi:putative zinc finger/helix-turn-helix YgiT family protein